MKPRQGMTQHQAMTPRRAPDAKTAKPDTAAPVIATELKQ